MFVEHMCDERTVGIEPLTGHHLSYPLFLLRHVSDMVPVRIKNNVSICLLKATKNPISSIFIIPLVLARQNLQKDVHHLQLSLHNQSRIRQYPRSGVFLLEDRIWIFGYMYGRK